MWLDVLSALLKETPKLKYQVKLKEFRAGLLDTLTESYRKFLELELDHHRLNLAEGCDSATEDIETGGPGWNIDSIKFEDVSLNQVRSLSQIYTVCTFCLGNIEDQSMTPHRGGYRVCLVPSSNYIPRLGPRPSHEELFD